MSLAEDIKVKGFQSDWHEATINIVYTSDFLTRELERRANEKKITLQQFNVLRILRGQYPNMATNMLVKERMITDTADISRLIDRLVLKGLVSRSKCKADKRAVDLLITEKGLILLDELQEEMSLMNLLPQRITKEEASILNEILDKIRGNSDCT